MYVKTCYGFQKLQINLFLLLNVCFNFTVQFGLLSSKFKVVLLYITFICLCMSESFAHKTTRSLVILGLLYLMSVWIWSRSTTLYYYSIYMYVIAIRCYVPRLACVALFYVQLAFYYFVFQHFYSTNINRHHMCRRTTDNTFNSLIPKRNFLVNKNLD